MKRTIEIYTNQKVTEQIQLTGGFSFETWLITLDDGHKLVFRTGKDTEVENGKKFIVSEVFEKEDYFYKTVNSLYINRCPEIYLIDKSKEIYHQPYQIMSFIEGEPLDKHLINADKKSVRKIFYEIGKITAEINNIEINEAHDLFQFENWEKKFKKKLNERMAPLIDDQIMTDFERDILLNQLSKLKAQKTNALLHLDMRLPNLIFKNNRIYVIDAENCEVGDPLYELAIVSVAGLLDENFLEGYREHSAHLIDIEDLMFKYYQLERQAALVNLFKNILKNEALAQRAINIFERLKSEIMNEING